MDLIHGYQHRTNTIQPIKPDEGARLRKLVKLFLKKPRLGLPNLWSLRDILSILRHQLHKLTRTSNRNDISFLRQMKLNVVTASGIKILFISKQIVHSLIESLRTYPPYHKTLSRNRTDLDKPLVQLMTAPAWNGIRSRRSIC